MSYIQKTKDAILDYLGQAQQTEAKIKEAHGVYLPEAAKNEETRLRKNLAVARRDTEEKIDAIFREASKGAETWGTLDGEKLTADVKLLQGQGVTLDQFNQLVDRYQDNYTMLDALRKYGEARNAEAYKAARDAGNRDAIIPPAYDLHGIPGPDAKVKEFEAQRKRADYFLNVADGTGFSSEFERKFALDAADKQFEAWGKEGPELQRGTADDFVAAWGFGK